LRINLWRKSSLLSQGSRHKDNLTMLSTRQGLVWRLLK
jgi:hypothetical protein